MHTESRAEPLPGALYIEMKPQPLTIVNNGRDLMRWTVDARWELWTGERWIDLERDLLQKLDKLVGD